MTKRFEVIEYNIFIRAWAKRIRAHAKDVCDNGRMFNKDYRTIYSLKHIVESIKRKWGVDAYYKRAFANATCANMDEGDFHHLVNDTQWNRDFGIVMPIA